MAPRVLLAGGGTGGHLYPALNLAAAIRRAVPQASLMLLGARRGIESRVLPTMDVPFRLLPMEPLYRSRPWRNWRLVWSLPDVAGGLWRLFRDFDPQIVVGTGGYAAGPAVALAIAMGRRTAIQEQNARPGLVTRALAPAVDQLHLGYPEARARLRPGRRTQVFAFGNPVAVEAPSGPGFDWPDGRIVAVIGGSQGARGLNERLLGDLEMASEWPTGTWLVWVTGPVHFESVARRIRSLRWADRIQPVAFIPGLGAQLRRVDLAVGRSGAMFCSELAAAGVPALLVPFPEAAAAHQTWNATALSDGGGAVVLEEPDLAPGQLWSMVAELLRNGPRLAGMASAMRARGCPDAAARITTALLGLTGEEGDDGERR